MSYRTLILAVITATPLVACDWNEGPAEELDETVDDIRDGNTWREVKNEAGDIFERRNEAEKRLDKVDKWIDDRRAEIADGTREADAEVEKALNDMEKRLENTRDGLADAGEDFGDDLESSMNDLEKDMDRLFDGNDR